MFVNLIVYHDTSRKKTDSSCLSFFKPVTGNFKIPKVKCYFCCVIVTKNGSRMKLHIQKCKKCTDNIKQKYLNVFESGINKMMLQHNESYNSDCKQINYPEDSQSDTSLMVRPTSQKQESLSLNRYFVSSPSIVKLCKYIFCPFKLNKHIYMKKYNI